MLGVIIERVEIYRFNIPMEPFTISLGTIANAQNVLVKIFTRDGPVGWGEASPFWMLVGETQSSNLAVARDFAQLWLGKDALDIEGRMNELHQYLAFNPTIKSAFDMALYDIAGKTAMMPLYQLLGGENRVMLTDETIGLGPATTMAEKALRIMAKGAPAIKVKLGTTANEDIARIRHIRKAIGPHIPLRIDANQGWDVPAAIAVLQNLADCGIEYCEEPVKRWNNEGLKRVRDKSPILIMADESVFDHHDALRIVQMQACDYINIKLAKSAGLFAASKVNAVAEAAGIRCMMGSMCESRLGLTAAAHFAAARRNIFFCDLDMVFTMHADPVIGGISYHGHEIHLPDAPGIGAEVDMDFLKEAEKLIINS